MWFSEKALIFVDTRSAALAVYRQTLGGRRLERFAFERFESHAGQASLFSGVLTDSKAAVSRLARELKAPSNDATILLPLGAAFPSVVELGSRQKVNGADVQEDDVVRFRLSPLLPFPISQAEVRTESSSMTPADLVLAQAIPSGVIAETEALMESLSFGRPHIGTALSATLRGLPAQRNSVDLIFGDSACAVLVRDAKGLIEAIHLRLLLSGDNRAQRAVDEALRATKAAEIRAIGEDVDDLRRHAPSGTVIHPAFDLKALRGVGDPQQFPFLGLFHEESRR